MAITVLIGRAIELQGIDSASNAMAAAKAMTHTQTLVAQRGSIMDRNGQMLAQTLPAVKVVANPYLIATNGIVGRALNDKEKAKAAQAPQAIAEVMTKYFGGSVADYLPTLSKATQADGTPIQYAVMRAKVPMDTYQNLLDDLSAAGWYGIYKEDDPIRQYPGGTLASNVVGFLNGTGEGGGGTEYAFNDQLHGTDGNEAHQVSAYGRIPLGTSVLRPAVNGTSYTLTLDSGLQWPAQRDLAQAVTGANAKNGSAIVMNVKTGEVLAMATYPSFDSNDLADANPANIGNRAISSTYEPGSVQKVLTMAALLDQGLITPDTKVEVPGRLPSGDGYITDADQHPQTLYMTARGVIYNSSNIGAAELARLMSKSSFAHYLASFGLGSPTGIELPGEPAGNTPLGSVPDGSMPDYTRDQIAFGQGLSVTAMQEAAALAAVVNGGVYNTPTILKSAVDGKGDAVAIPRTTPRRVISKQASDELLDMMESVVAGGTGQAKRMIAGYRMAGKSGTAQTYDPTTGRYINDYTASYVTVAPVEDPTIMAYVVVNGTTKYGSQAAFPTAKDLMALALPRYGILPENSIPPYTKPLSYQP